MEEGSDDVLAVGEKKGVVEAGRGNGGQGVGWRREVGG